MLTQRLGLNWVLCVVLTLTAVQGHAAEQSAVAKWGDQSRSALTMVRADDAAARLDAKASKTVAIWVKLEGKADRFPALASNKPWEAGKIVDLISTSNMGITRSTGSGKGWAIALQPNGSWHWNIGNVRARLDYLPTAERQPINDGKWHLLAFTIDRESNTSRLYYDGKNVAVYAINGFGDLTGSRGVTIGGDQAEPRPAIEGLAGQIENAVYSDTALSDEDIFKLYQKRFPQAKRDLTTAEVDELKVLAWNIWHGARNPGVDKGIQQAIDFIKHTQADVITMQETYGSGPIIADRLGYYFYLRSSNLSVISKYPITDTHDLYQPFRFGGVTLKLNQQQKANVFSLWIHYLPAWRRDSGAEGATAEKLIEGEWKTRASEMRDILKTLKPFIEQSDEIPLIVGGDFNSPSSLDWTDATSDWHNGLIVDWPVSRQMLDQGFTDSYRAIHPDPTKHKAHDLWDGDAKRITYRIDYVYTHGKGIAPTDAQMMNTHNGTWPSDHPAVLSTLKLTRPKAVADQLGIISYNIWEGFADNGLPRYPKGAERKKAVSEWLNEQNPAIVDFQELNGYTADRLAKESDAWGHGHAATVKEGGYIVGLTSREPIEVVERHLKGMHHGLLHARTMGIDCFVVHFSPFKAKNRQREAEMVIERAQKMVKEGRPVIIMGDFNAVSPQDRTVYDGNAALLKRMREGDARHGHVQNLIDGQIDYTVMQAFIDAGFTDLYAKHRGDQAHDTSERRIDYIFASADLADRLKTAGWHTGGKFDAMSDHSPTSAVLAGPVSPQAETKQLRVLAYNIRHAKGSDAKVDYDRLAKIIKSAKPDLVALQEVDNKTQRTEGVDQAKKLAELAGMQHHTFAQAMPYQGGGYGNAILSQHPVISKQTIALDTPDRHEPRSVGVIEIKPWGKDGPDLTFTSTHLSNESSNARLGQVKHINRLFDQNTGPIIIAGDFNFRPGSEPYREMSKRWSDTADEYGDPKPTSPARNPRSRIDYVFTFGTDQWRILDIQVLDEPLASDHRPVLAVLELIHQQ